MRVRSLPRSRWHSRADAITAAVRRARLTGFRHSVTYDGDALVWIVCPLPELVSGGRTRLVEVCS